MTVKKETSTEKEDSITNKTQLKKKESTKNAD